MIVTFARMLVLGGEKQDVTQESVNIYSLFFLVTVGRSSTTAHVLRFPQLRQTSGPQKETNCQVPVQSCSRLRFLEQIILREPDHTQNHNQEHKLVIDGGSDDWFPSGWCVWVDRQPRTANSKFHIGL